MPSFFQSCIFINAPELAGHLRSCTICTHAFAVTEGPFHVSQTTMTNMRIAPITLNVFSSTDKPVAVLYLRSRPRKGYIPAMAGHGHRQPHWSTPPHPTHFEDRLSSDQGGVKHEPQIEWFMLHVQSNCMRAG